ncbi:MAG: hypothetical protein AVDCRST_MAG93-9545 [uncultured Chloroflexia bacterium]|uniref:Putative 4-hydroxy-4-methyl-2-oxoglutarate aldolase n=1 Tax=uncultured Chloroflexia bacterium TaxID=1672391 RepID=A0A6J4NJ90_9CHLR|nr:MAG: hypothetical protein AVDCRST_MAG93-9545 [uncultured Chloroflexia bacterium]
MEKTPGGPTPRTGYPTAAGGSAASPAAAAVEGVHPADRARHNDPEAEFRDTAREGLGGPYSITRDISRPSPEYLERLRKAGAIYPVAFAGPLGLGANLTLTPKIKPVRPRLNILGPAFTVKAHDHLMPMYAMELAQPGDVLVIDAGGYSSVSIFGGSMTWSANLRKLGGVVINGMICDSGSLVGPDVKPIHEVPVFCRGAVGAYTTWDLPGLINVPIFIEGHRIDPGDLIVGAQDGVAVVPRARLEEALIKAEAFVERVPGWHDPMRIEGKTWFEVLGLSEIIERLRIPEKDI